MKELLLKRVSTHESAGTFGTLQWAHQSAPFAVCLENPWKDNAKNVSCIPSGRYWCKPFDSPTHGPTFQIMDVPGGRTFILYHRGNVSADTEGCVLIGEYYHFLHGQPSVAASGEGWREFWDEAKDEDEFMVDIAWAA